MKLIGLTGAPGCGKSTVLKIFADLGWKTVDSDAVCAELHADRNSGIHEVLSARWGNNVIAPDGSTNKKAVADIVFADESERKWLENILHPFIGKRVKELLNACGSDSNVMFDVPLLFECGWNREVGQTVAVWAPPGIQMKRLLERGWSREHALFRIQSQLPAERKLELADYGLINHSTLDALKTQCVELHSCLIS